MSGPVPVAAPVLHFHPTPDQAMSCPDCHLTLALLTIRPRPDEGGET